MAKVTNEVVTDCSMLKHIIKDLNWVLGPFVN